MSEKCERERQQTRNRRGYLTWRFSRLHYQFMSCIRPGTSAFFAWEEHFPSVCSCLLMGSSSHGPSNSMGQVPWHLPWGPTATTLQLLCAWTGCLLCPSQLGTPAMVWKSGKVMCCRSTDTLPYHEPGQMEQGRGGTELGQEVEKASAGRDWRQHNNPVTSHWLEFNFLGSLLCLQP